MRLTRATALRSIAAGLLVAGLTAPVLAQSDMPPTIVDLAARDKNLTVFATALHTTGLDEVLKGPGPFTIFAPTDDAFAKLAPSDRAMLTGDPARMRLMLLGHIVNGMSRVHPTATTVAHGDVSTADGGVITLGGTLDHPTASGAGVVTADMHAGNGLVTTLDRIVLPS